MALDYTQRIPVSMPSVWGVTLSVRPLPRPVSDAVDHESGVVATDARDYAVPSSGSAFDDESAVASVDVDVIVLLDDSAEHLDALPVFLGDQVDFAVSKETLLQASQPLLVASATVRSPPWS